MPCHALPCLDLTILQKSTTLLTLLRLRSITIFLPYSDDDIADKNEVGHHCGEAAGVGRVAWGVSESDSIFWMLRWDVKMSLTGGEFVRRGVEGRQYDFALPLRRNVKNESNPIKY